MDALHMGLMAATVLYVPRISEWTIWGIRAASSLYLSSMQFLR